MHVLRATALVAHSSRTNSMPKWTCTGPSHLELTSLRLIMCCSAHAPNCPAQTPIWSQISGQTRCYHTHGMCPYWATLPWAHSSWVAGTPGTAHRHPDSNRPAKTTWHTIYTEVTYFTRPLFHKMNPKRSTLIYSEIKMARVNDKKTILKTARGKQLVTYKENHIQLSADFSVDTL